MTLDATSAAPSLDGKFNPTIADMITDVALNLGLPPYGGELAPIRQSDHGIIYQQLMNQNRVIQSRGWAFNTSYDEEVTPQSVAGVAVSPVTLSVNGPSSIRYTFGSGELPAGTASGSTVALVRTGGTYVLGQVLSTIGDYINFTFVDADGGVIDAPAWADNLSEIESVTFYEPPIRTGVALSSVAKISHARFQTTGDAVRLRMRPAPGTDQVYLENDEEPDGSFKTSFVADVVRYLDMDDTPVPFQSYLVMKVSNKLAPIYGAPKDLDAEAGSWHSLIQYDSDSDRDFSMVDDNPINFRTLRS